jgi:predicted Zn-dependent peptidase
LAAGLYHVDTLASGLTVATVEMPQMVGVSVGLWIGVGSRSEPAELNGACHFIEHLLFKGTRRRSARQISEAVEGIGGYLNAYTSEEITCFHARAGHQHFLDLLDVLVDMLLHSQFAPAELAKEREVIKEEIAMYLDEPQHQVQELLNATLWPDQALGRPITGTPETLDRLTRTDLLAFLRSSYVTGATVVVAAGRVRHRDVVQAVERYARSFTGGRRSTFSELVEDQQEARVALRSKKIEQTQLAVGIRTCSRHDERRFALRLLNTILGENMSSRLFQVIREDRGLVYSIYSTPSFFADTGDLVISAGLDTDNLEKTLRLIIGELRRFTAKGPSVAELRRAKDYVFGQMDLSQESTDNQMNWVAEQWLGYGQVRAPGQIKRRLARVSAAEISAAAREFFKPNRTNLALVSPLKSTAWIRPLLGN